MAGAVRAATENCDALIMAAAPADFRPAEQAEQKIKRGAEGLRVDWSRTKTSSPACHGNFIKVGFAAETNDLRENARAKIARKGLDLIVANDVRAKARASGQRRTWSR